MGGGDVKKVCVLIGSRANYSSIKSAMRAVAAHPALRLQLVVGASALLDRFGSVVDVIEADGFLYKMCRGIVGTLVQCGYGRFTPAQVKAMQAVKRALDPRGILNPGKMFERFEVWKHPRLEVKLPWDHK